MSESFQRKKEDFNCQKCGNSMVGNGYTNHCSRCLWSKHVDINPGDREARCRGMMCPIEIRKKSDRYLINHKCQICGIVKSNLVQDGDNFEEVVRITQD